MFISWAVTSYQSNGARCDFSQGISVCLIEIPYPDPSGLPGLSYTNGHPRLPLPRNSHASRSSLPPVLHSFDLLSPSLAVYACVCARARLCAPFHHYVSFVLLGAALSRPVSSSLPSISRSPAKLSPSSSRLSLEFITDYSTNKYCVLSVVPFHRASRLTGID